MFPLRFYIRYRILPLFPIFVALLASALLLIILALNPSDESFYDKTEIKTSIQQVIRNGGSLGNIKHIYNTQPLIKKPLFVLKKDFTTTHYIKDTPLSFILQDLFSEYYSTRNFKSDSLYLSKLQNIIKENEETNPFDKLEDHQKYNFDNIRAKLDTSYINIQSDIIKITDELNNKNQLVNKYLNKSDTSFNLSIIALAVTILLSAYQIYQNFSSSKVIHKILSEKDKNNKKQDKSVEP